jgi:hypothetical protein
VASACVDSRVMLADLLAELELPRSSCFSHRGRLELGDEHTTARAVMADTFQSNDRCDGSRRMRAACRAGSSSQGCGCALEPSRRCCCCRATERTRPVRHSRCQEACRRCPGPASTDVHTRQPEPALRVRFGEGGQHHAGHPGRRGAGRPGRTCGRLGTRPDGTRCRSSGPESAHRSIRNRPLHRSGRALPLGRACAPHLAPRECRAAPRRPGHSQTLDDTTTDADG